MIVDDSPTETQLLKQLFEGEDDMEVIACAKNGEEAIDKLSFIKPDIITMDILMPVMNGFDAIRSIMTRFPTPIVVITSTAEGTMNTTFQALEAGALSILQKPKTSRSTTFKEQNKSIIQTVRSMSEINVIRRRFHLKKSIIKPKPVTKIKDLIHEYEVLIIGCSVGGPQALKIILSKLPKDFPLPILIVQHMTNGFIEGFAKWLNDNSKLTVKCAEDNEVLVSGKVYFAPDNHHLEIKRIQGALASTLTKGPTVSSFCPSVTVLLKSAANVCGKTAIGILLTGMGNDGAEGLLELKRAKGHTLIQDQESAVVFGMAGVAQSIGAVDQVVELDQIADYLIQVTKRCHTVHR